ncbi:hypothetical protein BDQ17DRAFT_1252072, partial [Cyathus striatus]
FYRYALCPHAKSLETLKISSYYEGRWCFRPHSEDPLSTLTQLKHITIYVIGDSTCIESECDISDMRKPVPPRIECMYDPLNQVVSVIIHFNLKDVISGLSLAPA